MRIAHDRMSGVAAAQRVREMELRSVAAEIGAALRVSDRTIQGRMADAEQLVARFPATVGALAEGRITVRHAEAVRDAGCVVDDPAAREAFEQVVLDVASGETVARTRAYARQLAERVCPESVVDRRLDAAERRGVTVREVDDGMAELIAYLPATLAFAIADRLGQQGRAILALRETAAMSRGGDAQPGESGAPEGAEDAEPENEVHDTRTLGQVRADLLCDLLLGGAPSIDPTAQLRPGGLGAIHARVQVTVPVAALRGGSARGAVVDGRSPIDARTLADILAGSARVDRVLEDVDTGAVLAVDRVALGRIADGIGRDAAGARATRVSGRHHTEPMRRFLHARDVHCRFPGCRRPARHCQIDHNTEHRHGGPTAIDNLACLCVRHHTLKTETGWRATQRPDGALEWISPLGRRHRDRVPPRVVFVADPAPF